MTGPPKVAAVVLNWNGLEDTPECLETLRDSDYTALEIIVVDNGSTDGSPDLIEARFPSVCLIRNGKNLGFTGGNNVGIERALAGGADYVWLLNSDAVVERDTLTKLVATARAVPDAGLVSPTIYFYDEPSRVQFRGDAVDWSRFAIVPLPDGGAAPGPGQDVVLWGTALLVGSRVFERIGFLDDRYFAYHEDCEFSLRAGRAGYRRLVDPEARVYHKDSRATGSRQAPLQVFLRVRNGYFLFMDNIGRRRKARFLGKYLSDAVSCAAALREAGRDDAADACLQGLWHGLRRIGGPWDRGVRAPAAVGRLFRTLTGWHPYLWAALLSGDLKGVFAAALKKARGRTG